MRARPRLLALLLSDPAGALRPGTEVRHQSEDWEFDAPFLYDFVAPLH